MNGQPATSRWRWLWLWRGRQPDDLAHAFAVDSALATVAALAALAVAANATTHPVPPDVAVPVGIVADASQAFHHATWWLEMLVAIGVRMAPLAGRRFRPLTAFWVSLAACAVIPMPGADVVNFIALVPAAYSAVAHSRFRVAAMVSMPAAVWVLANPKSAQPGNDTLFIACLVLIPVIAVGTFAYQSERRLVRLQAEHESATQRALVLERARLAGELHDVVTHNVSMMIVQAGAARQVLVDAPDDARQALRAVEATGRAAMTELRHLLGLLSPAVADDAAAGDGASPPAAADADGDRPDLRPQPGLAQLRPLVDRMAAAGLPVELQVAKLPPGLPPGMDLAAFRVAQEALTNVIKHAGKPLTSVTITYDAGDLVVEVADGGAAVPATAPAALPGSGRGLLGLRERAALYGGELHAGPRPGGGWLVRARFPVDPDQGPLTAAAGQ